MKIVTWNVNSLRQRLPRLVGVLGRHEPDIVCLQETKVTDDAFPHAEVSAAGYHASVFGQRGYNGVAILARSPLADIILGFGGDPVSAEARVISATVGDLRVVDLYAVNGNAVGHPTYDLKLRWFHALASWLAQTMDPEAPIVVSGDFNVAPRDLDVHDPALWSGRNLASEPERRCIRHLLSWGLTDLGEAAMDGGPGAFTWWDYRMGAFHRGWGLRLDLVLGSAPVATRLVSVEVDREERKPTAGPGKPSDHAPVVVTLGD